MLLETGCAQRSVTPAASPRPEVRSDEAEPAGMPGLFVSLTFGGNADLDLFVTGPLQETVYFANTPGRSGGVLVRDMRCDDKAPRSEVVRFEKPRAGRYRVGVDFPRRCSTGPLASSETSYTIEVRAESGRLLTGADGVAGSIELGRFEPVVLEFEWNEAANPDARGDSGEQEAPGSPRAD